MTAYRKKPVTVEAEQWRDGTALSAKLVINWVLANGGTARYVGVGEHHHLRKYGGDEFHWGPAVQSDPGSFYVNNDAPAFIAIDTLEGTMRADSGDYIIRGVKSEFYPCKPDIFDQTYEEIK